MSIRPAEVEDIDLMLGLTEQEGWGYTRPEFERLFRLRHDGSFVWDDGGRNAFITCVRYGRTAVIGHLVVSCGARGMKVGRTLLDATLLSLDGEEIDSTLVFSTAPAHRLYASSGFRALRKVASFGVSLPGTRTEKRAPPCESVAPGDLAEICAIDRRLFGDDRSEVLAGLYREHPGLCFKQVRGGAVSGYIFARLTPVGGDIGPWASLTCVKEDVRALMDSVLSVFDGPRIEIGFFDDTPLVRTVLEGFGCVKNFDVALMVRGRERYPPAVTGAMGIIAFEIG